MTNVPEIEALAAKLTAAMPKLARPLGPPFV